MSRVAYCAKCFRIVLASEVTGFDTCPKCNEKYKFTEINQHSWYLMTADQRNQYKTKWFGSEHVAHDTVKSFNQETGQEAIPEPRKTVQDPTPEVEKLENADVEEEVCDTEENFITTQGDKFEGKKIKKYLGVVTGTQVISTSALTNIERARQHAMDDMINKCSELGAKAAICIKIDTTISDDYVILTATGTAVVL